ncbi:MAG: DUF748 domain-containing protein [Opitutaceae bacterium]
MGLSSRRRRWLAVAGALLVAFTVLGFVIAPPILKAQLVKRLALELGRKVQIERIRLNPYALSVTIEGLAIQDRDGGAFVGWSRVYVNFDSASVFVREWRFQEISASVPGLRVVVNKDGTFNFSDLLTKFAPVAEAPSSKPKKPGWPLRVASLSINDAALEFADHSRSTDFATKFGPVSFLLKNFHTSPGDGAPYEFAATTEVGESFTWRGTLSAAPLGSQGEFTVRGIQLPKYAPYYREMVRFDLTGGTLDVSGRYDVAMDSAARRATLSGGAVHLQGFKLAPRDGKTSVFELDDINVTGIDADMGKMAAAVGKVEIKGGRVAAQRSQDGVIDLVSLLAPAPAPSKKPVSSSPAVPSANPAVTPVAAVPAPLGKPDLKITDLTVRGFAARFEDHSTPRVALSVIENVDFDAKNLTLADGAEIPMRLALAFPNQGAVKVDGTVVLSPMKAEVDVEATNVAFANVSPYMEPLLNLRIAQGSVSMKGHGRLSLPAAAAKPDLSFKGDVSVAGFLTVAGEASDEFSSWSSLAFQGIDFASEPLALAVNEITWSDPAAHLIVNRDGSNNLTSILRTNTAAPAKDASGTPAMAASPPSPSTAPGQVKPAVAPAPLPKITIGKVSITNGAFTLADRSVEPAVNTGITQFGGTIAGLSSTNLARADVDLKATVDGVGPVSITGKLDPLGAQKFVDLKVDFKNVDLTPFSPYTGKFAGYQLARGKLFLDVTAKLNGDKVDMANVVTLNQFTFGAATNSPDATKLPVRLGVALLKDSDGKMVIDIPVAGSIGDPEFRIGRVVWRVIANLLTKAATSPFSLLGAMFGGGGDELAYQDFAPGSSEVIAENLPKLTTLTKALGARPGLSLEIAGSFDAGTDGFALKQQLLAKQIRARVWESRRVTEPNLPPPEQLEISAEEEKEHVQKLFTEKFPPGTEFGGPLPIPPPLVEAPAPPKRGVWGRVVDAVTFKSRRVEKATAPPPVAEPTSSAAASTPSGPSLEEMKLRLADSSTVTDEDLRQLATARAQKIREHFVQAQIAPERLFLANEATVKGPRVFLQLQ